MGTRTLADERLISVSRIPVKSTSCETRFSAKKLAVNDTAHPTQKGTKGSL